MIVLTREERHRFAAWLEQQAAADAGLLEQMEKIHLPEVTINRKRLELQSCRVIARQLRETEEQTI